MPLFRLHKGPLSESMKTVREVKSKQDILDYVYLDDQFKGKELEFVKIEPYCFDDRNKWDTYTVKCHFKGEINFEVVGYTNGPVD